MLTSRIVQFCRFLRSNGFAIGIQETIDSLEAIRLVNISNRQVIKDALRALVCSSKEEIVLFDDLFEEFWGAPTRHRSMVPEKKLSRLEGTFIRSGSNESVSTQSTTQQTTGASAAEKLRKTDFTQIPVSDLPVLEEIAFRLWKRMSQHLIRRWRADESETRLDFRRTIRASVGHGGEPIELRYRGRKKRKLNLVILLDVSGSMDSYSMFLVRFVYALHKYFKRLYPFVFGTRLTYLGTALQSDELSAAMKALSQKIEDWSGGTRIGESLHEFNRRYGRKMLSRRSVVMILSDGWDTGNPEMLARELRAIKRKVRRVIWLNPLLGSPEYQPLTRGMAAALPLTDVFAPAHNLQSLLDLEKHLQWRS